MVEKMIGEKVKKGKEYWGKGEKGTLVKPGRGGR
jgi:hypothetical protein